MRSADREEGQCIAAGAGGRGHVRVRRQFLPTMSRLIFAPSARSLKQGCRV